VLELPSVLRAPEVLDKALGRASKATAKGRDRTEKTRNLAVARVQAAGQTIGSTLHGIVKGFPTLDRLPPFYRDLVDILVDRDRLKKHLGAVQSAADKAEDITRDYVRRIGNGKVAHLPRLRGEAVGRLSSIVNQVAGDLDALVDARIQLRRLPTIDPELPTIVVAGYPNVGKSAFVRAVSTGKPKVADYPFTTQGVSVGHFERGYTRYQILDTPGLLDRPMEKRNRIERQAIAALAHLADAVLFLVDPTETCGYPLGDQLHLLESVREAFPGVPVVVAENKSDLNPPKSGRPQVSSLTGEGVLEILEDVMAKVTNRGPADEPQ